MEHHIAHIDASNSSASVAADAYNTDENFASLETTSQGSLSLSLKRHKSSSNPSSSEDIQMKKSRKISASRTAARQSADAKTDPVNTMDNDTGLKSLDQQSSDAMSTASSKQGAEASYNKDNLIRENKRLLNEIKLLKEQIQALAGPSTSTRTIESPTSEWITIGSRRPAGRHAPSPMPTLDKPPTANRFQAFAEPNALPEVSRDQPPTFRHPTPPQQTIKQDKLNKPPPLIVHVASPQLIINITKNALQKASFTIKRSGSKSHVIYPNSLEAYSKIKDILMKNQLKFFTYTPKNEKPLTMLLKGIDPNTDKNELLSEINSITAPKAKATRISNFVTAKSKQSGLPLPMFVVQFDANTDIKFVQSINVLNYQRVRWEKLHRQDLLQCFNCQRIGHASANCHLDFRCVKCNLSHERGKCSVTEATKHDAIYCVNCEKFGHPASYRGCPKFKERRAVAAPTSNRAPQPAATRRLPSPLVNPTTLYSSAASGVGGLVG